MYLALVLLAFKVNSEFFFGYIKAIIHQVTNGVTIDGANEITWLQARAISKALRHDFTYPSIHFWHWLVSLRRCVGIVRKGGCPLPKDVYLDDYNCRRIRRQIFTSSSP